jgi:hypothetical protein
MNATADIDRLAGVLLVAVVLIHGIGIRLVSVHFRKRSDALARRTRPNDPRALAAPPPRGFVTSLDRLRDRQTMNAVSKTPPD